MRLHVALRDKIVEEVSEELPNERAHYGREVEVAEGEGREAVPGRIGGKEEDGGGYVDTDCPV